MKLSFITGVLFFCSLLFSGSLISQVFWTETFGSGCNSGTPANGYVTSNGTWSVTSTGFNGSVANLWYVSAAENGQGVGNCGSGCGTNPTLHISSSLGDFGAAYLSDGSGLGGDASTNVRAESPTIDCTGKCKVELYFEYIENGDAAIDNAIVWYFDGSSWTVLEDTPKSALCAPQGLWESRTITLPISADNNPNVRIGFQWVNNNDGVGTDPSVAIYNIQLLSGDVDAPVLTCAADINVYVDQNCDALIPDLLLPPTVTVTDDCTSSSDIILSQDIASGTVFSGHLTVVPVIVTATDLSGNSSTCSIDVRSLDTIVPVVTCPPNQQVIADASCSAPISDYTSLASATDNCSASVNLIFEQTPVSGTVINADQIVEILARDEAGNEGTCTFTVELIDTISPNITCPTNQTQETAAGTCDTLISDYTNQVIWNDNCTSSAASMTFQQSPLPLTLISGSNTVTITVIDPDGNSRSCDFQVAVIDTEDPSIACPADQNLPTNSACNATLPDFTSAATSSDNCSSNANITVTQSPAPGTLLSGVGTIQTVTLTAEDEAGNTSNCTFDVTLTDTTSPQAFCPSNMTEYVNSSCEFVVPDYTGMTAGTDNCYSMGDFTITQDVAVGTTLSYGVQNIQMTVQDPSGNAGTCLFQLTVLDTISPVISACVPDQVETADASCNAQLSDYSSLLSSSDNCDAPGDLVITQSPATGSFISGPTTVTITVSDLSGNSRSCDFQVIIDDQLAPSILCPSDTIVNVNANCEYPAPDLTGVVNGTDNCSSFADMTVSQSPAAGVTLSGSDVIQVTLTDENGNSTSCNVNVIPNDLTPPQITCPTDQFLNNGTNCDYQITDFTALVSASDNCSAVTLTQNPAIGTALGTGVHLVEITATDAFGNSSSCTFNLSVAETVDPTISCPSNITQCDPVVNYAVPSGADNCVGFSVSQTDGSGLTSGDQFPVGTTLQTFEVTDLSGNTASCSFTIEILESPDPANIITTTTSLCDTTSMVLEADPVSPGTGEWTVIAGGGNLNNQFSNMTGVNNLTFGANTFVWTVSSVNCGNATDTLTVNVYEQPLPANTQDTLYICADTSLNITGNQPNVGIGTWTSVSGGINFLNENSPNTLAYNFTGGWNDLIWTISNGSCPSSSDTLSVFTKPNTVIQTSDTSLCATENSLTLVGSPNPVGVSSIWYIIEGSGDILSQTSSTTLAENLNGGENIFVYAQNHPLCGTNHDTLSVTVELCGDYDPVIPTVITPNNDGKNDLFVIESLHVLYPECEVKIVNRWGGLVFESTGYEEPWNGKLNNTGEPLPMGTYFYRIVLNDSEGNEITGPISIIR
ncbi:MAG: HYR domain-containing protein [Brumimicrobium sp.]|nr:HYR domain-containing protein [Brumimicrobium sp.]